VCIVVSSLFAAPTVKALHHEFAQDLAEETVGDITVDPAVAIVTVVGEKMRGEGGLVDRVLGSLGRENLTVLASAQSSLQSSVSFVVPQCDLKTALVTAHRELELSAVG
jgi:aspartokinase/homoserine dehydrogenase 1